MLVSLVVSKILCTVCRLVD